MPSLRETFNLGSVPILICEGESDAQFLRGVFSSAITNLIVFPAIGGDAISPFTNAMGAAYYIKDRDFGIELSSAQHTLINDKSQTIWQCVDIEGYLLHADWLWQFAQMYPQAIRSIPKDQTEIEQQLFEITEFLVADHAGRRTLAQLNQRVNPTPFTYHANVERSLIVGGADANSRSDWENTLASAVQKLIQAGENLSELDQHYDVLAEFQANLDLYRQWSADLNTVRIYFSGKRIFQRLASQSYWQVRNLSRTSKKRPWTILRDELIRFAIEYAGHISAPLSDDPRLGDFGLLVSKILGRNI